MKSRRRRQRPRRDEDHGRKNQQAGCGSGCLARMLRLPCRKQTYPTSDVAASDETVLSMEELSLKFQHQLSALRQLRAHYRTSKPRQLHIVVCPIPKTIKIPHDNRFSSMDSSSSSSSRSPLSRNANNRSPPRHTLAADDDLETISSLTSLSSLSSLSSVRRNLILKRPKKSCLRKPSPASTPTSSGAFESSENGSSKSYRYSHETNSILTDASSISTEQLMDMYKQYWNPPVEVARFTFMYHKPSCPHHPNDSCGCHKEW